MIWFWSDPHLWHVNVARYCGRPFTRHVDALSPVHTQEERTKALHLDVEEMNEALTANFNAKVQPDDIVYCIGDLSLAFRPIELFSNRLNGKKYLIPGNHDLCHSYNKRSRSPANREKWVAKYEQYGWTVLPEQYVLEIPGVATFNVCHHPYASWAPDPDKYAKWRMKDDGRWLICGHVHGSWKTREHMINVGVDVWNFGPVSIDEIVKLMAEVSNGDV